MSNKVTNNFSITVGTANGSGSQTSNLTILRALFRMGIPVTGKNIFPSNIQGLPTWYTIRLSKDGYTARRDEHEVIVAMNKKSFQKELESVEPGGVLFYDDSIAKNIERDDITAYPMAVKEIVKSQDVPSHLRGLISNMVYVGVVAQMLGISMDKIRMALDFHFKGKEKPIAINMNVIEASAKWAEENLEKKDPYSVAEMDMTDGLIMADGNTAAALGSIYGGVQVIGWYPITPATSLIEKTAAYLPQLRLNEEGKSTYAVIQAEDEIAAVGMIIGGGWAGARSMTSTSGAGISLMGEFVGLAYFAEIPIVIWNVQRMGPSTGLPTRTSQGDLNQAYYLSQGDTKHIILLPNSPHECFEFGWKAFDVAERMQTPVFVLSDLDIGQNHWMGKPFNYPDTPMDRGKLLWEEDFEKFVEENGDWGRYKDIDGDGIPYRTVAGNRAEGSTYFKRGTGHNPFAEYSENADVWLANMDRLSLKQKTARQYVPDSIVDNMEDTKVGIIAYGSTDPAIIEARDMLAAKGLKTNYLRLRALPFTETIENFVRENDEIFIVEMNHDGQLREIMSAEMPTESEKFVSVNLNSGLSLTAEWIKDQILAKKEN